MHHGAAIRSAIQHYPRRDLVKKVAVYKDKLAVQLPNRVVLYELAAATESAAKNGGVHLIGRPAGTLCASVMHAFHV